MGEPRLLKKSMTHYIGVLIILLFISCSNKQITQNNKIVITYIDIETESVINISCDQFDSSHISKMKKIEIDSKNVYFDTLSTLLQSFSADSLADLDVRVKIFFAKQPSRQICMDAFGHFYDNSENKNYLNDSLYFFINKIISEHVTRR